MTTFKYKAISPSGAKVEGIINAYNEFEAASKLRETCSIITKIEEVKDDEAAVRGTKIKDKDLAILCSQFSIILTAGLPIVSCVRMVAQQQKNKEIRKMLEEVAEDIDGGYPMAASFEKNNPKLPRTFIETIRAGETAGTLETCFERLHKYFDKSSKTRAKLVSALIYPALVIAVGIIVLIIIMVVAVPAFTETFNELEMELPAITRGLIAVSNFFTGYWWVLLLIVAVLAAAYLIAKQTEAGRRFFADFSLTKAPLRKINVMNASATFASTMSTMLSAGLPVPDALEVTSAVVPNYVFALGVDDVRQKVEQGGSIGDAMKDITYFPQMLTEMTGVGERSGAMEQTLDVVGDYFSNEVEVTTSRLISILEPAITIVLAVMTVVLLLAVYLPLFSMYGGM